MRLTLLLLLPLLLAACTPEPPGLPRVAMTTDLGTLVVEIDTVRAPISATNFLRYVDDDRWGGARFYRTVRMDNQPDNDVKIEVIQGGLGYGARPQRLSAIEHETTEATGLRHRDGTLSMARSAPGTASSEFFICIGDQPALDYGGDRNPDGQGFAAFGQVVEGMDVVRQIQQRPDDGQMLVDSVAITQVRRVR